MEPVIEVKNIYKSFKTVQAVRGIDISIKKGQFVAILGPNGAGKTTLVEMIEGIRKPDKGEIFIMGKKWKGNEDELHRIIGLSLQETYFTDKLNVWETLKLFASFYNLGKRRCSEIIEIIGLEEKRKSYVVNLSGGQRQKLALGIALLSYPQILLLDEPTTGLDPLARREVWSILMDLKKQSDTSLILTTHYMEEAEQLCDYIIIIDNGKILKEGTLKDLLEKENHENIVRFSLEESMHPFDTSGKYNIQWDSFTNEGTVVFSQVENELPEFLNFLQINNLRIKNLECKRKTLDDLFTSLTGKHLHE
ncbi:MAG: ABC transporter ATP-binding protein [Bacteroidetes bacterium]|nr:ABC transporter ATP-binding protein [Bacteroidota bacterium]